VNLDLDPDHDVISHGVLVEISGSDLIGGKVLAMVMYIKSPLSGRFPFSNPTLAFLQCHSILSALLRSLDVNVVLLVPLLGNRSGLLGTSIRGPSVRTISSNRSLIQRLRISSFTVVRPTVRKISTIFMSK